MIQRRAVGKISSCVNLFFQTAECACESLQRECSSVRESFPREEFPGWSGTAPPRAHGFRHRWQSRAGEGEGREGKSNPIGLFKFSHSLVFGFAYICMYVTLQTSMSRHRPLHRSRFALIGMDFYRVCTVKILNRSTGEI